MRTKSICLILVLDFLIVLFFSGIAWSEWSAKKSKKTLEMLRQHVANAYYNPAGPPFWENLWAYEISKLASLTDRFTFYSRLNKELEKTGISHFRVYPREARLKNIPFVENCAIEFWGKRAFIGSNDAAERLGCSRGAEIIQANGEPFQDYYERYRFGERNEPDTLLIEDPDGSQSLIELPDTWPKSKNDVIDTRWLNNTIAYIELTSFAKDYFSNIVTKEIKKVRRARGIVIDLRKNRGGCIRNVKHFMAHFLADTFVLGKHFLLVTVNDEKRLSKYLYRYNADKPGKTKLTKPSLLYFDSLKVVPIHNPISVPLVILIGYETSSAAEIASSGFQTSGRGFIIGRKSAGAVLRSTILWLPYKGRLKIPIAGFLDAHDKQIENNCVTPDITIQWSRENLIQGIDPDLETALLYFKEKLN